MAPRATPARDAEAPAAREGLDLAPLAGHLGFLLRLAQQSLFETFHRRFGTLGLTPARYSVLVMLRANPDARQVALAEALRIKPPNLAVLVAAMQAEGLIERRTDAANRRANKLRLTPAGAALLARSEAAVWAMEEEFAAALAPEERRGLLGALARLAEAPR